MLRRIPRPLGPGNMRWKRSSSQFTTDSIVALDDNNGNRYYSFMIRSFRCVETGKVFNQEFSKRLPQDIQRVAMRKLWMLDAAPDLNSLRPSSQLEALKGDRTGAQHSDQPAVAHLL